MNEITSVDFELADFLENARQAELKTWERQRTSQEMGTFVTQRLEAIGKLEDFDLTA
mgnify:CR=1 FL=1